MNANSPELETSSRFPSTRGRHRLRPKAWMGLAAAGALLTLGASTSPDVVTTAMILGSLGFIVVAYFQLTGAIHSRWRPGGNYGAAPFETLLENVSDAVVVEDLEGRIVFANPAFHRMFGAPSSGEDAPRLEDFVHPQDRDRRREHLGRCAENHWHSARIEFRGLRNGEDPLELESAVTALHSGGAVTATQSVIRDLTRQRLLEKSQRAVIQRMEFFISEMPLGCIIWDLNFSVQEWNEAAERIFGWPASEALHRHYTEFLAAEGDRASMEKLWNELSHGTAVSRMRCANQTKSGELVECEWFHTSLVDETGRVVAVASMARDLTECRTLQQQLLQSQKMEAVGRLVGGISHDFNNLLTAILGHTSLALMKLDPSHDVRRNLDNVQSAAERGAELVHQLMRLGRDQPAQLEPVSLNRCAEEVVRLVRPSIDPRIQLDTRIEPGLWRVEADTGRMEHAVMNLVFNARDAIGGSGHIIIRTANRTHRPDVSTGSHIPPGGSRIPPGEYVALTVSDDGHGMDAATIERVFDPFFTTKPSGRGTGLGLAMAFAVVQQHEGHFEVSSTPGKGSAFRILLPRTKRRPKPRAIAAETITVRQGGETVLFVDDETSLRTLGRAVLEAAGHKVIEAADGQEAVEVFERQPSEIGLVIMDLTMPRKSGWEAFEEIRERRPDIAVILSTGYSLEGGQQTALRRGAQAFLAKPYRAQDLLQVVAGVLDGPRAPEDAPASAG